MAEVEPSKWLVRAELCDAWRVFPRLILSAYAWLCWDISRWFMALKTPQSEQMAFVTVIIGLAVPLTGWYMQTGRTWGNR